MADRRSLGLTGRRTPYKRLSGGQQQRLSLACAVVGRPELVFLDEPTAGMDPQARHLVWDLVGALRDDGVTVLLTTHLMDEAEAAGRPGRDHRPRRRGARHARRADREAAPTTSCGSAPARSSTCRCSSRRCPRAARRPRGRRATYLVEGHIDPQVLATVTAWCAQQGVLAEDLRSTKRSLEDVFLELTGRELRS